MSADAAKALVRRFYTELFRDPASAEECIGPDYIDHNNAQAGQGPEVIRAHVAALLYTFPDFTMEIEDVVAEGDRVVTRVTGRGTHARRWLQIEPTGSVITVKGINTDRVSDGRIVEQSTHSLDLVRATKKTVRALISMLPAVGNPRP